MISSRCNRIIRAAVQNLGRRFSAKAKLSSMRIEIPSLVNSGSVDGDFFKKYGNSAKAKLSSTVIILELNVRF